MNLILMVAFGVLPLQEDSENPEYKRWAAFKVGSWVKMKSEIVSGENKIPIPQEVTFTLIELDEKKAVVEEVLVTTVPSKEPVPEKPKKRTYRAKSTKKEAIEKEGDEELEIAGKKLACHWTLVKPPGASGGSMKTWATPEVPGGVARMELNYSGLGGSQRLTAISWEKK